MKYLSFFFVLFNLISFAGKEYPEGPSYQILSSGPDKTIHGNKAKFTFRVLANDHFTKSYLQFSDNGRESIVKLDQDNSFFITTNPGPHKFMIYLDSNFREIITDSIIIQMKYHTIVQLNFKSTTRQMLVKKPVIYLYPEEKTAVSVQINPVGELLYTWPKYEGEWKVIADTNGKLFHNEKELNYLFWEAKNSFAVEDFKSFKNCFVHRDNLEAYMESCLDKFGLTSMEKADFMTFWMPEMLQESYSWYDLRFLYNSECEIFAKLNVDPNPQTIGRIYLVWRGLDLIPDTMTVIEVPPVPELVRNGFTLIEWGGLELKK